MCLMHDSDEYGILRWTLQEISNAIGCKIDDLQHLIKLDILKGTENTVDKVSFSTSLAQKNRYPLLVILIDSYGPLFYSSRMVRDEYVRQKRADGGSKSLTNPNVPRKKQNKKTKEKDTLSPVEKDTFSPSPSSSSSSSSSNKKHSVVLDTKTTPPYKEISRKILAEINRIGKEKGIISTPLRTTTHIVARLNAGYSEEKLLQAWINCSEDPWFLETGKITDLEFIYRKSKIDAHINKKKAPMAKEKKQYDRDRYREDPAYKKKVDENRDVYV